MALVVVDGKLRIGPTGPAVIGSPAPPGEGHLVVQIPGGWDVTAPDGGRLLVAAAPWTAVLGEAVLGEAVLDETALPGATAQPRETAPVSGTAQPPDGVAPYDVALLDLIADPFQLGELRRRGLIQPDTAIAACYVDDRGAAEAELARRCALWGATLPDDGDRVPGAVPLAAQPPTRTLVLGGARSGKSGEAELRLAGEAEVLYLATGATADETVDPDWARRVAAHRSRRPRGWATLESPDVAGALRSISTGAVLVDGIGTWLAGVMDKCGAWDQPAASPAAEAGIAAAVDDLVAAWRQAPARVVAVSDETGSGVVPPTVSGRLFRDTLGLVNQRLAAESEEVVLVVAGRVMTLPT
ncbi:MAG: bifunctional adenosylcobinamide kinase/adenosylcobinamide-phosphate guanylyltransferase [Actinomycetota bacterium]